MKETKRKGSIIHLFIIVAVMLMLICSIQVYATESNDYSELNVENGVIISYQGKEEKLVIPADINGVTITRIGESAFAKNTSLKKIVIPDTVTYIGSNAFEECTSLNEVIIGQGVTNIGPYAFYNCTSLENIILPQRLKKIDTWTFGYCKKLKNIDLPQELQVICPAAFYSCNSLEKIVMPESVTEIGTHCLRGCSSLSNVQLSNQIKEIPYRTFSGCESLRKVVLPDEVQTIAKEAFYQCDKLEVIELPNSVTNIGAAAFYECVSLKKINLPDGLKSVESETFYGCTGIEQLTISNAVTSIGSGAFHGCAKLISLRIPASVKNIGDAAFEGCNKIVEIYNLSPINLQIGSTDNGHLGRYAICIHTSETEESHLQKDDNGYMFYVGDENCFLIAYIGDETELVLPSVFSGRQYEINQFAFYGNKTITRVNIPEGITNIGNCVFSDCTKLYKITLPKSLEIIGDRAFYQCFGLDHIVYKGNRSEWEKIVIGQENENLVSGVIFYVGEQSENSDDSNITMGDGTGILEGIAQNIFLINFLLTLLWGIIFIYTGRKNDTVKRIQRRNLFFVVIVCVQWVLISGLRADSVGADTANYMRLFDEHIHMDWKSIIESMKTYYITGSLSAEEYEPGYILLEKLIGVFTTNHTVYKFIIAIIFMSALGYYVYKDSDDSCLSFVIYDALFYNMFSLTGYRQVVSASIGILIGYQFIKKGKLGSFLILLLIASLFHRSTLVFILFYILANKKLTRQYLLGTMAIVSVMLVFRNQLFNYVKVIVGYDQYAGTYGFAQLTFTILLLTLTVVAFYLKPQILRYKAGAVHYYNGLILMWMMMPFAMVSPTSMRLVYDFGFVLLLFIPTIVKSFKKGANRIIIYGAVIFIFGYFIVTKTPVYQFYW